MEALESQPHIQPSERLVARPESVNMHKDATFANTVYQEAQQMVDVGPIKHVLKQM